MKRVWGGGQKAHGKVDSSYKKGLKDRAKSLDQLGEFGAADMALQSGQLCAPLENTGLIQSSHMEEAHSHL